MNRPLALASAVAVLLASVNARAASNPAAASKFADSLTKVLTQFGGLKQVPSGFDNKFRSQLARTLKDSKCVNPSGTEVICTAADSDSLDAGNDDLQTLEDMVSSERGSEADKKEAAADKAAAQGALHAAITSLAALSIQIQAALPQVNNAVSRATFNKQLTQELGKDGCTQFGTSYNCSGTRVSADALSASVDNLKTLLADVKGANASDPRLIALKNLAQAATQVLTTLPKLQEPNAQGQFRLQLGQKVDPDGCTVVSGAYDCSNSHLPPGSVQGEIDAVNAILAALNAAIADPRSTLLKDLTQAANQASHGVTAVINGNQGQAFARQLAGMMAADGCAAASGIYDCSKATIVTGRIDGEIGAAQGIIAAEAQANATNPTFILRQTLSNLVPQMVNALSSVQDPGKKQNFSRQIGDLLKKFGCTPNATPYYDCSNANLSGGADTAALKSLLAQIQAPDVNLVGSSSSGDLVSKFTNLSPMIARLPNPKDSAPLTASLTSIVAESGCSAAGGKYDCSKTTYDQYQKASSDLQGLTTQVQAPGVQSPGPSATGDFAKLFSQLTLKIADIPNPDDVASLTAKLAPIVAESGCSANGGKYDCSKIDNNEYRKASPDLNALMSVAEETWRKDGPVAAHTAQASAAAALMQMGRELTPQKARDAFTTAMASALKNANCTESSSAVDCSRSTGRQIELLANDLAAIKSLTQDRIRMQEDSAANRIADPTQASDMHKATTMLDAAEKMIDGAPITDAQKQPLYGKVMALRDQIENQPGTKPLPPAAPTAGQQVANFVGSDGGLIETAYGNALGSVVDTFHPTTVSGTFGPNPAVQAAVLVSQIQTQIAIDRLKQTH